MKKFEKIKKKEEKLKVNQQKMYDNDKHNFNVWSLTKLIFKKISFEFYPNQCVHIHLLTREAQCLEVLTLKGCILVNTGRR